MNFCIRKYAKSVVFIALIAMVSQAMAACCSGAMAAGSESPSVVDHAGKTDCHSQAPSEEGVSDPLEKAAAKLSGCDCDESADTCCKQLYISVKSDKIKSQHQSYSNLQSDIDVSYINNSIQPQPVFGLDLELLPEFQQHHQTIPYYLVYCSFLE